MMMKCTHLTSMGIVPTQPWAIDELSKSFSFTRYSDYCMNTRQERRKSAVVSDPIEMKYVRSSTNLCKPDEHLEISANPSTLLSVASFLLTLIDKLNKISVNLHALINNLAKSVAPSGLLEKCTQLFVTFLALQTEAVFGVLCVILSTASLDVGKLTVLSLWADKGCDLING